MKNITLLALGIFIGAAGIIYIIGPMSAPKRVALSPAPTFIDSTSTPVPVSTSTSTSTSILNPISSPKASQSPDIKPTVSSSPNSTPVSTPVPTPNKPALTASEVAKHSTKDDCYLIINNKVYNVSSYFGSHPGGDSIMLGYCGAEASTIFSSIHSNFAWDLLSKYLIGNLVAG